GKENSVFFGIVSALKSASWLLTGLLAYHGSIRAEKAVIRCQHAPVLPENSKHASGEFLF
ncbi:MAG TPA: hypothetical protein VFC78_09530, partial [Tepidisphaeraceae bacterium]|nr:hypothetical protein [Tepidisphaeraceae bacterium]